jgi:hypothetical protein
MVNQDYERKVAQDVGYRYMHNVNQAGIIKSVTICRTVTAIDSNEDGSLRLWSLVSGAIMVVMVPVIRRLELGAESYCGGPEDYYLYSLFSREHAVHFPSVEC